MSSRRAAENILNAGNQMLIDKVSITKHLLNKIARM